MYKSLELLLLSSVELSCLTGVVGATSLAGLMLAANRPVELVSAKEEKKPDYWIKILKNMDKVIQTYMTVIILCESVF